MHTNVVILTYCRNKELLYGTELIFRTLRVGFPDAEISVYDNASLPETRQEIEHLARSTDSHFFQLPDPGIPHQQFLLESLRERAADRDRGRALVFLDPDICFWENCEDFDFGGLMAGVQVAAHEFYPQGCIVMPRLHTSFLWIPDCGKLMAKIDAFRERFFDFDPFRTAVMKLGDVWLRYDTGAVLYSAISDEISFFGEKERSRYDHIFAGSHMDLWRGHFKGEFSALLERVHRLAQNGDFAQLRGIWREMDRIWKATFPQPGND